MTTLSLLIGSSNDMESGERVLVCTTLESKCAKGAGCAESPGVEILTCTRLDLEKSEVSGSIFMDTANVAVV